MEASEFRAEMAETYNRMAKNHHHPDGPWAKMTDTVVEIISNGKGTILDLASGPGQPGASIAQALPQALVIATDLSKDMVEMAQAMHQNIPNLQFRRADMKNLDEFEDESVDCVTCCYGYMFPPEKDREKCLQESHRVLKQGGVLIATTWDKLNIVSISSDVMSVVLGVPLSAVPPPKLNPMALSAPGLFEKMVIQAGFSRIRQEISSYPMDFGRNREKQPKIATSLYKEVIDGVGEDGWCQAEVAFWSNISKVQAFLAHIHMQHITFSTKA